MLDDLITPPPGSAATGRREASSPLARAVAETLAQWAPPPKIALADWIESSITLPADVSATPGAMKLFSYQRGICEAVDDPTISRISFVKPVRIGATMLIVAIIGAYAKNDPCNILALQPTLDDARDFVVSTVEPTFAASAELAGVFTREKVKRDTILSRRFPGGSFKCVAAASPRNLRRHTIRILVMDEVDAYEPSAEGSATALAEKRTLSFPNRLIFQASTPTNAESSNILKAYEESDQRIFELPCPHCGEHFEPLWRHVHWEKSEDGEHLPHTAHMVCPHCAGVIEESAKPAMVEAGRWRATRPHVQGHAGFKTSALISTLANACWAEIVREFLAARKDPDLLRVWTNTLMGEAWIDKAGEGLNDSELENRAEPCSLEAIPADVLLLTAGVDVQDDRLEVVTLGHTASGAAVALDYETVHGPPTSDDTWQDLDDLLKRRFAHPLGGSVGYDAAGVDSGSGSHTDIVYRFTRPRFARRIVSLKGDGGNRPLIDRSSKPGLYIMGADTAKSRLYGLLARPGLIRFSHDLPSRFYEELCGERRVTFYKSGQVRKRWERIPGVRNEALDCTCMCDSRPSASQHGSDTPRKRTAAGDRCTEGSDRLQVSMDGKGQAMTGKPRPCVHCGSIFTPEFPRGAARTCSEECSDERRKAVARACAVRNFIKNRAKRRAYAKGWYARHRAKSKAAYQAWAKQNRERINARKRAAYEGKKAEVNP